MFHLIQALNHNLCLKNEAFLSDTLTSIAGNSVEMCMLSRYLSGPSPRGLGLGRTAMLTNVKLNDGGQEVVAIQVHYLVPGGDEILDELLV